MCIFENEKLLTEFDEKCLMYWKWNKKNAVREMRKHILHWRYNEYIEILLRVHVCWVICESCYPLGYNHVIDRDLWCVCFADTADYQGNHFLGTIYQVRKINMKTLTFIGAATELTLQNFSHKSNNTPQKSQRQTNLQRSGGFQWQQ